VKIGDGDIGERIYEQGQIVGVKDSPFGISTILPIPGLSTKEDLEGKIC
jgi:hypothetical protein